MERWTLLMIRYRWAVVAAWVVILFASIVAMSGLSDLLTNRFTLPGTDTARAENILEEHFGQKTTGSFSIVVKGEPDSARGLVPHVRQAAVRAAEELPTSEVASVEPVADNVVVATIVSNLEPADAKGYTDDMREAIGTIPGAEVYVSGQAAIEHDLDPVFEDDLFKGEILIAIPIALLILMFTFGTAAFLIPFLFAGTAIPATLGIIWIFANFMELTTYLQNLVMLIGLGIAVDYSLLIVYRYREELRGSRSKEDAIARTMATAGRAVVFSGTAVAIGLALMLFMPLPFMRGFGLGGLIIPAVSVICALTLLPVLLFFMSARAHGLLPLAVRAVMWLPGKLRPASRHAVVGALDRIVEAAERPLHAVERVTLSPFDWLVGFLLAIPRLLLTRLDYDLDRRPFWVVRLIKWVWRWTLGLVLAPLLRVGRSEPRSEFEFWTWLARMIMRRPVVFAAGTSALLLGLAIPIFSLELGPGSNKGIPQDLEGVQGLNIISEAVGEGAIAPTAIVVDTGRPAGADDPVVKDAVERLTQGLQADPEVASVTFDSGAQSVDSSGRYLNIQVVGKSEYGVPEALDFVDRLRDNVVPAAGFPSGVDVFAGGGPPSGVDFLDLTYGAFPWLVLAVLFLTYLLLLRAFRSIILPLKAIILNLLSIGAAYGLLVIFFKWGGADALGLISFDQIEGWIPVFVFAMVFGLSMDYEVFLVSRMREEWDAGRSNEDAVALGLAKTGRIVTAAGLVMFAAFMGFVAGSIVGLQQFGFGLAAAILIDVTIVRALLVPSAMKLFGRWNWWLPENVARVFRVKPSPLGQAAAAVRPSSR